MEEVLMPPGVFIGIDVSKETLDIAVRPAGTREQVANTEEGIATLIDTLLPLTPTLVLMEATGRYHEAVAAALMSAGLPIRVANPTDIKHFAKFLRLPAKTDALDAALLARCAEAEPTPRPLAESAVRELNQLVTRRQQLVEMRKQERTRRHQAPPTIVASITKVIDFLTTEIKAVERQVTAMITANSSFRERAELLRSVKGVGPVLSMTLLAKLPELGTLSPKQLAKLVGVAPMDEASGGRKKPSHIRGGRKQVRHVLYEATLTAKRFNPQIKQFAHRLKAAGKKHKVVMVACMRKLLTILTKIVQTNQPWQADLALAA
jgi:transposase